MQEKSAKRSQVSERRLDADQMQKPDPEDSPFMSSLIGTWAVRSCKAWEPKGWNLIFFSCGNCKELLRNFKQIRLASVKDLVSRVKNR